MHYSSTKWETGRQSSENLREIEYFQGFYPASMKRLQTYVAEECDKMDYLRSPMYDEYPDRMMIQQICRNICLNIPDELCGGLTNAVSSYGTEYEAGGTEVAEVEVYELVQGQQVKRSGPWGPPSGPPPWGPPPHQPRPPHPPHHRPGGPNWMEDIVRILLLNEMQRRRCRNGRCF